jgi:hypothetical protein
VAGEAQDSERFRFSLRTRDSFPAARAVGSPGKSLLFRHAAVKKKQRVVVLRVVEDMKERSENLVETFRKR